MSLFDYPRINITGLLDFNPATANNDDNANVAVPPLALFDSANVTAITGGMDDATFRQWVQEQHSFVTPTPTDPQATSEIIPAEWNYYGDLGTSVSGATVAGVVTGPRPDQLFTSAQPYVPASALVGATLAYSGSATDINSQGSPPATQFFIPELTLTGSDSTVVLQGPASKGVCQWINFVRNVNAQADQGAGGYIYHVVMKSQCKVFNLPGFDGPDVVGAIFRYYLFNGMMPFVTNADILALYKKQLTNPITLQFVATIAPLRDGETITSGPVGRLLAAETSTITGAGSNNNSNGGPIGLAPAMLQTSPDNNTVSVDFIGTFPDNFQQQGYPPANPNPKLPYTNDKWDFGPVTLRLQSSLPNGLAPIEIGAVDYTDTDGGNERGWIFDFDLSKNPAARDLLASDPDASFFLESAKFGAVLNETELYIVTNQLSIYAEQNGANDAFVNQGYPAEPATIAVYRRGKECAPGSCPPISLWSYASVPLQTPGASTLVTSNFSPGDPLVADVSQPGNLNYIFTIGNQAPPATWASFIMTLLMTNSTTISLRILPNGVDFTPYYTIVNGQPVGNATGPNALTFAYVYANVLQTYYLLFPAMDPFIPLNSEQSVNQNAQNILAAIDPATWLTPEFMPRTRDMSESRRTLLAAYCNMVLAQG